MDRLPPELLSSCFESLLPIPTCGSTSVYYSENNRVEIIDSLRLVSKAWNQRIIQTPNIWSYVELRRDTPFGHVQRLIERSKAVTLHIRIMVHDLQLDREETKSAIATLWGEAHRWETYVVTTPSNSAESIQRPAWFKLFPSVNLPRLREVWIMGYNRSEVLPEVNAPRVKILVEFGVLARITSSSLLELYAWQTKQPTCLSEWRRLGSMSRMSPNLAELRLVSKPSTDETLADSQEARMIMQDITFPSLKRLNVTSTGFSTSILFSTLRAPKLAALVIEKYDSDQPFSIPSRSSCPNFSYIRFKENPNLSALRRAVSALAPVELEGKRMEIEVKPLERGPRRITAEIREQEEQMFWFEKSFTDITWIRKHSESSS
ncbi:hypothetical protein FRB90_003865 [Tulasnella sp. 427]|nr:hypothetical protein FRB90_003865 [Tulasnella sp. 427]